MALRQAALSNDLKELNAQLALKVHMVNKITQDQQGPYSTVKAHYDATVTELENQIAALQHEKDELANLLAQASSNVNACMTRCPGQHAPDLRHPEREGHVIQSPVQATANSRFQQLVIGFNWPLVAQDKLQRCHRVPEFPP